MNRFSTLVYRAIFVFILSVPVFSVFSQTLLPSIGIGALPNDNDPICTIPWYLGDFDTSGIDVGDAAADFTLYSTSDNPVDLITELQAGKPVLMITGSYTCPVFRNQVPEINAIQATYGNDINIIIVYTVEAHPTDTSPYFGTINTTNANINAGILYDQPTTYGERKVIAKDMEAALLPDVPVYLDGPCNEWWSFYGPAPQNAYLINTDGTVYAKHPWFNKWPDDIRCDIDSLLGNPCGGTTLAGSFEFYLTSSDTIYGAPGKILNCYGMLVNNSADNVVLDVRRLQNVLDTDWLTSMCLDACLPTDVDTTTLFLAPGDSQGYTMYFYAADNIGISRARIGFRNQNDFGNQYVQWFTGISDSAYIDTTNNDTTIGITESTRPSETVISIYPNPMSTTATLNIPPNLLQESPNLSFRLFDLTGRLAAIRSVNTSKMEIGREMLAPGMYLYEVRGEVGVVTSGKLLVQ